MTIDQLRYFVAAASSDNFSKAAEQEFTTQSTISKQIKNLENEIEVQLFRRNKRRIFLSDAGRILLADAVSILDKVQTLRAHAEQFSTEDSDRIRVFSLPFVSQYNLRIAVKKFLEAHPTMNVEVFEVEEREILKQLEMNMGDVFIIRDNISLGRNYQSVPIASDNLALFVSNKHPLAREQSVSMEMLSEESFIFMHDYTSIYQLCVQSCEKAGFSPHIIRTARLDSIIGAVANEECVSLLMLKSANVFMLRDIIVVPIRPRIESNIVAVISPLTKKRQKVQQLIKMMTEYAI